MQYAEGSIEGLNMVDKMKSRFLKDGTLQCEKNKRISLHFIFILFMLN
jgi:hypothetical protein